MTVYKNSIYALDVILLQEFAMTLPRSQLICASETPYYHCICRCVRRACLCGEDALTGKDYSHRKGWVLARIALLAEVFTIEICAYAVMANHYHLVIRINQNKALRLSDQDVALRWGRLFSLPAIVEVWLKGQADNLESDLVQRQIALWRRRLADVSWYMRCLNEYIARQANAEDGCTGRFWEGRFKSQAILDDPGLLACMVYVDLNPLRAALVSEPEASSDVSIYQRLDELMSSQPKGGDKPPLLPFSNSHPELETLPCTLTDYLLLVDWTARARRNDKCGAIPADVPPILVRLGIDHREYLAALKGKQLSRGTVIGKRANAFLHAMATRRQRVMGTLLGSSMLHSVLR